MRTLCRTLIAAGIGVLLTGCGDSFGPIPDLPRELSVAEGKLVEADNRFAFKLFREIAEQEPDGNIFISPLSVGMALGMTYNGAAGSTRTAMQQALELNDMSIEEVNQSYRSLIDLLRNLDPRVEFLLANSIWYRSGMQFEQGFLDLNSQYFDATVSGLDFTGAGAANTINEWVRQSTAGKIDDIVDDPIDSQTIMFLLNAIYFKADWAYDFDEARTNEAPYFLKDGTQTTVDLMSHETGVPIRYLRDSNNEIQIVDLPYGGNAYSMTILVPDEPERIGSLVEDMSDGSWAAWIDGLDSTDAEISMPKFTLEYEVNLNDALTALGMGVAFTPGSADFTNLYAPGNVFIDKVKHKTFVAVDEEGTEAAAATSVEMSLTSAGPQPILIDRPFVFAIRERYSGTVLFVGRMLNPNQG